MLQERLDDVHTRWQHYESLLDGCEAFTRSEVWPWTRQCGEVSSLTEAQAQQDTAKVGTVFVLYANQWVVNGTTRGCMHEAPIACL